jgi:hypothetical protein
MRICLHCHRITVGEPLFCNFCGRTYDVKLCSARHANPRSAQICSQCGSREFSIPQPRAPFWLAPLLWLVPFMPRLLVVLLCLSVFVGFIQLLTDQQFLSELMLLVLVFVLARLAYLRLPASIRTLLQAMVRHVFQRVRRGPGRSIRR